MEVRISMEVEEGHERFFQKLLRFLPKAVELPKKTILLRNYTTYTAKSSSGGCVHRIGK